MPGFNPMAVTAWDEAPSLAERRMAKWNRRQFLSGLLATASAGASASAQASPLASLTNDGPAPGPVSPATAPLASAVHPAAPAVSVDPAVTVADLRAAVAQLLPDGAQHDLRRLLPVGLRFGRWRIVAVHPVKLGAVPVVVECRDGTRFQVDIVRRDAGLLGRHGVAETRHYALFLSNVGDGHTPTPEELGQGIIWLAALLRPYEHRGNPGGLMTLRERHRRFPRGRFDALCQVDQPESTRFEAPPSLTTQVVEVPRTAIRVQPRPRVPRVPGGRGDGGSSNT